LIRCSNCDSEIDPGTEKCARCGQTISSVSQMPTGLASPSVAAAARRRPISSNVGRLASSPALEAAGFTPGTVVGGRYRVIGLIGRGGMGEVYRADDLKLGQPVALKFLPKSLSRDRERLERFFAEVRNARQVAHPNVCRVYDIGELDGDHFLSMEYVDGEDLSSLLKRIGRLPPDKAVDVSRQLCAGLAAAHDRGILHRDLKPANVMIDGRGRARIMDFGLAVASTESAAETETSGTPAYMAPEQFAGKGASVRSDLYALGLVLYELFTGKRAFDAVTIEAYRKKHSEETPTSPSTLLPGFDPAVERVILRCVEKDPQRRPSSAAKVAAALPGGDPLAAALAAGETPSPEMVAAAGQRGGIEPAQARWLLLGLAASLVLAIVLTPRANIVSFVGLEKSPEVLRERAREILQATGLGKPADFANTFLTDYDFLAWARSHGGFAGDLSRDAVAFAYRQAATPLSPGDADNGPSPMPVTVLDPPPVQAGMAEVRLDARGRLLRLSVVPPEREKESGPAPETDWSTLFRQAGVEKDRFTPVEPRWTPRSFAGVRAAWEGPHPEHPAVTMRVEAASYRGRPVSFQWIGPWTRPSREPEGSEQPLAGGLVWEGTLLLVLLGSAFVARRNVKAGRGDRRGAIRIGTAVFFLQESIWVLGTHHVASSEEGWIFINGFCNAAGMGIGFWLLYLALEPFARRRWPQMLISWTRAISGDWRDPVVGRDLLLGAALGIAAGLILGPIRVLLPMRLGIPGPPPHSFDQIVPVNPALVVAGLIGACLFCTFWVLGIVFLLAVVRALVRRGWLAGLLVTLLFASNYLGAPSPAVTLPLALVSVGILVGTTVRFGVLPAIVLETCRRIFGYRIYSNDPSNWIFYAGMIAVAGVLLLAYWATKTALAGRPLFGTLLEEKAATSQ
jgi:protein kinase-like protein